MPGIPKVPYLGARAHTREDGGKLDTIGRSNGSRSAYFVVIVIQDQADGHRETIIWKLMKEEVAAQSRATGKGRSTERMERRKGLVKIK